MYKKERSGMNKNYQWLLSIQYFFLKQTENTNMESNIILNFKEIVGKEIYIQIWGLIPLNIRALVIDYADSSTIKCKN